MTSEAELCFIAFFLQAGPVIETILSSFPEYLRVKDLPHDDMNYKVYRFWLFVLCRCVFVCLLAVHFFIRWSGMGGGIHGGEEG